MTDIVRNFILGFLAFVLIIFVFETKSIRYQLHYIKQEIRHYNLYATGSIAYTPHIDEFRELRDSHIEFMENHQDYQKGKQ